MVRVAVMGAGSWGTAYAAMCADAGSDVVLWARRQEVAAAISHQHRNPDYLGEVDLNPALHATDDPEEALAGAQVVVHGVPSHALRATLAGWVDLMPPGAVHVSLIKGIELSSHQRGSQVIASALDLPPAAVVVVSGPNLAKECAKRLPGGTVAAGEDPTACATVQRMSHTGYFRVYTNDDVVGVELGGAVKNAIALAAGMADGMGFGDNTKAMLVTRGLAEMTRLGVAMGADPLTFSGLAGMGDLVATCMSAQSRNRHVGEQLGRGRSLDDVIAEMNMVAEGVKSSKALADIARSHGVEMPIVEHVVKVVHEGMDPAAMVAALMGRDPKPEFHGMPASVPTSTAGGSA